VKLGDATRQKSGKPELPLEPKGEALKAERSGEALPAAHEDERSGNDDEHLMERVVGRDNVIAALKRVQRNKGSPGIDGMTVEALRGHLRETWRELRAQLLAGTYKPQPVKRQSIPKSDGGMRELGIPTALDRFIQQAILQVLQPRFDPSFSQHSHGFRPGRRAHDAVLEAQKYIQEGREWVVDVDLEKFFDRVNHDVLMGRLAKRIADKRVLRLIRRYLDAGIMADGLVTERHEGTPQGGPLSPLLANVLLDEVDKELEKRGHAFVRYADDCNVYVRSERAGQRVMQTLQRLYAKLRLRVNESKSAVARPWERSFLGFTFVRNGKGAIERRIADKSLKRMAVRIRSITGRHRGRSLDVIVGELAPYLRGCKNYYGITQRPTQLTKIDSWLRHRLRAIQLKHWKNFTTICRELQKRGLSKPKARKVAGNARRWWKTSAMQLNIALPVSHFDGLGLPRLHTPNLNSPNRPVRTRTPGGVGGTWRP
jgi:RNA-directed DNA polymerase